MPRMITNNFDQAVRVIEDACIQGVSDAADDLVEEFYEALGNGEAGIQEDTGALANSFYVQMAGYRGRKSYEVQMADSRSSYLEGSKTNQELLDLLPDYAYTEEGFKRLLLAPVKQEESDRQHPTAIVSSGLATSIYWELGHNSILSGGRELRRPFIRRIARAYFEDAIRTVERKINQGLNTMPKGRLR